MPPTDSLVNDRPKDVAQHAKLDGQIAGSGASTPSAVVSSPQIANATKNNLRDAAGVAGRSSGQAAKTPFNFETHAQSVAHSLKSDNGQAEGIQTLLAEFISAFEKANSSAPDEPEAAAHYLSLLQDVESNLKIVFETLQGSGLYKASPAFRQKVDGLAASWSALSGELKEVMPTGKEKVNQNTHDRLTQNLNSLSQGVTQAVIEERDSKASQEEPTQNESDFGLAKFDDLVINDAESVSGEDFDPEDNLDFSDDLTVEDSNQGRSRAGQKGSPVAQSPSQLMRGLPAGFEPAEAPGSAVLSGRQSPVPAIEDEQDIPEEQNIPQAQDVPEEQNIPQAQDVPEEQNIPQAQDVPEEQNIPQAQDVPEEQNIPQAQDVPEGQDIPEAQNIPEEQNIPEAQDIPDAQGVPGGELDLGALHEMVGRLEGDEQPPLGLNAVSEILNNITGLLARGLPRTPEGFLDASPLPAHEANSLVNNLSKAFISQLNRINSLEYKLTSRFDSLEEDIEVARNNLEQAKTAVFQFPLGSNLALATISSFVSDPQLLSAEVPQRKALASDASVALQFLSQMKDFSFAEDRNPRQILFPVEKRGYSLQSDGTQPAHGLVTNSLVADAGKKITDQMNVLNKTRAIDGVSEGATFPTVSSSVNRFQSKVDQLGSWRPAYLPTATRSLNSLTTNVTTKMDSIKPLGAQYSFTKDMVRTSLGEAPKATLREGAVNTLGNIFNGQKPGTNFTQGQGLEAGVINSQEVGLNLLSLNLYLDGYRAVERAKLTPDQVNAETPNDKVMRLVKQDMSGKMDAFKDRKLQASYTGKAAIREFERAKNLQEAALVASRQKLQGWDPSGMRTKFDLSESAVLMINGLSSEQRRLFNPQVSRLIDILQKMDKTYTDGSLLGSSVSANAAEHVLAIADHQEIDALVSFKEQVFDTDVIARVKVAELTGHLEDVSEEDRNQASAISQLVHDSSKTIYAAQRESRGLLARFGTRASTTARGMAASAKSADQISNLRQTAAHLRPKELLAERDGEIKQAAEMFDEHLGIFYEPNAIINFHANFLTRLRLPEAALEANAHEAPRIEKVAQLLKKASKAFGLAGLDAQRGFDFSPQVMLEDGQSYSTFSQGAPDGGRFPGAKVGFLPGLDRGLLAGDSRFPFSDPGVSLGVSYANVVDTLRDYESKDLTSSSKVTHVVKILKSTAYQGASALAERVLDLSQAKVILGELQNESLIQRLDSINDFRQAQGTDLLSRMRDEDGKEISPLLQGVLHQDEIDQYEESVATLTRLEDSVDNASNQEKNLAKQKIQSLNSILCKEAALEISMECIDLAINALNLANPDRNI